MTEATGSIRNGDKTHCPQGHPYSDDNTSTHHGGRKNRVCLTCRRAHDRERNPERYQRKKAALTGADHPGASSYPGVTWDISKQAWVVRLKVKGKRTYLGSYDNQQAAAQAYLIAHQSFQPGSVNPKVKLARHGLARHWLYKTWSQMVHRCTDPTAHNYRNYGARGINYEPGNLRWADYSTQVRNSRRVLART